MQSKTPTKSTPKRARKASRPPRERGLYWVRHARADDAPPHPCIARSPENRARRPPGRGLEGPRGCAARTGTGERRGREAALRAASRSGCGAHRRRGTLGARQGGRAARARRRGGRAPARGIRMTADAQSFRARLEQERTRAAAALENLRSQHEGSMQDEVDESRFDNHLAENASVTIDREIDYSLVENETRLLAAIDAALKRIDDGTFGRCERCGKEIEEERL